MEEYRVTVTADFDTVEQAREAMSNMQEVAGKLNRSVEAYYLEDLSTGEMLDEV